jgi:hypothetical protein
MMEQEGLVAEEEEEFSEQCSASSYRNIEITQRFY